MSAISPPEVRVWWRTPIGRTELVWMSIAFLWGLFMFFMMIYWHGAGGQNLSNEAYRTTPEKFAAKTDAMIAKYKVREESGDPVVHPPAGSDVYLFGRRWQWWPMLELEKGKSYRMHLTSLDWAHGFSLQPVNLNIEVQPGYEMVFNLTPTDSGEFTIVCNEYCGIGHHLMLGKIFVK